MNQVVKRAEDLVLSSLAVIAPVAGPADAALLVRLSSPGPSCSFSLGSASTMRRSTSSSSAPCIRDMTDVGARKTTTRGRSAGHAGRPLPAPVQHRRAAAAPQCPSGKHVPGRASPSRHRDDGRRPLLSRGCARLRRTAPRQARHHRLCAGQRACAARCGRSSAPSGESSSTNIMSTIGRSGSTSGFCLQPFARSCSTAMHTDRINFLDVHFDRLTFDEVN